MYTRYICKDRKMLNLSNTKFYNDNQRHDYDFEKLNLL